jgi:AcrR family transcriptional regulator
MDAEHLDDSEKQSVVPLASAPSPDDRKASERILTAAEQLFAEAGFDGVSLRQIATKADVPVGLVSYHFGGKLGIYRAIFELRTPAVVEQRKAGLALAAMEDSTERRLEMIVKAVLLPMLKLRAAEESNHFGILLAREVSDPKSIERRIIQDMLDPIAMDVIEQLRAVFPNRTQAQIHWAYQMMIGTMTFAMADAGRISRLSSGAADPSDAESTMRHLLPLLTHGLRGTPVVTSEDERR